MTINEMCTRILENPEVSDTTANAIVAALHAGQAMRDNPGSAKAMYEWDQATRSRHVD